CPLLGQILLAGKSLSLLPTSGTLADDADIAIHFICHWCFSVSVVETEANSLLVRRLVLVFGNADSGDWTGSTSFAFDGGCLYVCADDGNLCDSRFGTKSNPYSLAQRTLWRCTRCNRRLHRHHPSSTHLLERRCYTLVSCHRRHERQLRGTR